MPADRLAALALRPDPAADETRTRRRHERRAGARTSRASSGTSRRTSATTCMEALSGVKGDNSREDLRPRPRPAGTAGRQGQERSCKRSRASTNVGIFHVRGQSHLEFRVDPEKCQKWGVIDGRRQQRRQQRPGRQGHVQHGRGREAVSTSPSAGPSGCGTARRRSWTSRWTSSTTRWSWHRARASRPTPAGMPCLLPRSPAAWPTRPTRSAARRASGCATWSRPVGEDDCTGSRTASSSAPATRRSTASRASA